MSVYVQPRGVTRSALADLTTTNATNLIVHGGRADKAFHALSVCDDSGSGSTLTVTASVGGSTFCLWHQETITGQMSLSLDGIVELLADGDVISVQAGHAGRLHVVAHYTEYEGSRGG